MNQCGPLNISSDCGKRCASLDGDADRLIYFYFIESDSNNFRMLDGDKIALLFADHFTNLLRKSNLNLKVGMVQTAYANGSSTNYAEQILVSIPSTLENIMFENLTTCCLFKLPYYFVLVSENSGYIYPNWSETFAS